MFVTVKILTASSSSGLTVHTLPVELRIPVHRNHITMAAALAKYAKRHASSTAYEVLSNPANRGPANPSATLSKLLGDHVKRACRPDVVGNRAAQTQHRNTSSCEVQ